MNNKALKALKAFINKIKKDRNWACLQNIHIFINRRGINIEAEDVRKVIDNLILRNVVIDKGKQARNLFLW